MLVDAGRWRDAAGSPWLAILGDVTAPDSSFVLVHLWRGQIGFMGHDIGPQYLGRACARMIVRTSPDDGTRASVTSEKIDCPPDAPMPVRMDG